MGIVRIEGAWSPIIVFLSLPGQRGDTGSNILASIELGSCNNVCLTQWNTTNGQRYQGVWILVNGHRYLVVWNFVPPTLRSMMSFMEAVSTSLTPSALAIVNVFALWSSEIKRFWSYEIYCDYLKQAFNGLKKGMTSSETIQKVCTNPKVHGTQR